MIMECSVRYAGDRVRVTAQLIDGVTNTHRWNEAYDGDLSDIFGIQADIASNIAEALSAVLRPDELASIEKNITSSQDAYSLYLKSLSLPKAILPDALPEHLAILDEAIALDPDFALAYAQKAFVLNMSGRIENLEPARRNAERALSLDSNLGRAYMVFAKIENTYFNGSRAQELFEKALQFSPNDVEVLMFYALFLDWAGEPARAVELAQKAIQLNPYDYSLHIRYAVILADQGDLDGAVAAVNHSIRLRSSIANVHLSLIEIARSNNEAALENLILVEQSFGSQTLPDFGLARLAYTNGRLGRKNQAFEYVEQLNSLSNIRGGLEVVAALALGDETRALELLMKYDRANLQDNEVYYSDELMHIKANAWNDPVLEQPEFIEARKRLGFRE
jgi:Tfp pilus assembly protein PilF